MIGLWAGSVYVTGAVTALATREGYTTVEATRIASYATMLLSVSTILGCPVRSRARQPPGTAWSIGFLLRPDGNFHRGRIRLCLLPSGGVVSIHWMLVFPRHRRREFLRFHAVASGTIQNGMSRERLCPPTSSVRQISRCGSDVHCRRGRGRVWLHRSAGRLHGAGICGGTMCPSIRRRNKRQAASGINNHEPLPTIRSFFTRAKRLRRAGISEPPLHLWRA